MLHLFDMGGGKKHLMGTELYVLFVGQISVRLSTTQNTSTTAPTAEQNWTEMLKMAEYIDKEIALSLVQPDAPEDETGAVTIATAKKLVRSIIYRTPIVDVAPVVHGRWIYKGNSDMWVCSRCGRGVNADPEGIDLYCYHCGAKMDEKE